MTEEEKLSKIEEIRKKLADGRATSATDADANGHVEAGDRTYGGGLQAVLGPGKGPATNVRQLRDNTRKPASDYRSVGKELIGERSGFGGFGDDHGSANGLDAETRASGRLIADDSIRPRFAKEEVQSATSQTTTSQLKGKRVTKGKAGPVKEQAGPVPAANKSQTWKIPGISDIPGIGKGKTLSSKEAADLREGFRTSIEDDFGYLDQWLRAKSGNPDLQVWSDVDNDELDKVADVFLRGAQRSPVLATVVRETVNTHDYIVVGMVFLPRLQQTVATLRAARANNPKQARWQRTAARRQEVAAMNGAHE
jgi:hypothetical protein